MRLIEDEHGARPKLTEEIAETAHIGLVRKHAVRDNKTRADAPGIGSKATSPPRFEKIAAVDNGEVQTEFLGQLVLPLQQHGGRRRDHDDVGPPSQEQLADDQPRLDRLAQADVVGNQQIDAWQFQRLGQREELVGVEANAGSKRCLKELPIGGRSGAPLGCPQERAEAFGIVKRGLEQWRPVRRIENLCPDLRLKHQRECLAL